MERALALVGTAIAMHACMAGWNSAAHRKSERSCLTLATLFWLLTALFLYETVRTVL